MCEEGNHLGFILGQLKELVPYLLMPLNHHFLSLLCVVCTEELCHLALFIKRHNMRIVYLDYSRLSLHNSAMMR